MSTELRAHDGGKHGGKDGDKLVDCASDNVGSDATANCILFLTILKRDYDHNF
jgi:hypothetical protein